MIYGNEYEEILRPGLQIKSKAGGEPGTLGCFARIAAGPDSGKIVLLTNRHVLYGVTELGLDGTNADVGQPSVICCWCCACRVIANNRGNGDDGYNWVTVNVQTGNYPPDMRTGSEYDAAVAILNDERPYTNEALYKGTPRMLSRPPQVVAADEMVWKIGAASGPTQGKVLGLTPNATYASTGEPVGDNLFPLAGASSAPLVDTLPDINHYLIVPQPDHAHFALQGDSGAVVVNKNNQVVGLFSALIRLTQELRDLLAPFNPTEIHDQAETLAVVHPIGPILAGLNITIDDNMQLGTVPTAGQTLAVPDEVECRLRSETNRLQVTLRDLEHEIRQTRFGDELMDKINVHHREIGQLINHRRAVTVAWHRGQGPAYMAHCLHSVRDRSYEIPQEVRGITPKELMSRLAQVLLTHGSEQLRVDVATYAPLSLEWVTQCSSVWQLVERIKAASG